MAKTVSENGMGSDTVGNQAQQAAGQAVSAARKVDSGQAGKGLQQVSAVKVNAERFAPTEADVAAAKVVAANSDAQFEDALARLDEDAEQSADELRAALAEDAEGDVVEAPVVITAIAPATGDLADGLTTIEFAQAGGPARESVDGKSALGQSDDDDGGVSPVIIGALALAAIGGGIAIAAGGGENDLPATPPPPPPPPANRAPVIDETATVAVAENGQAGARVFTAAATDPDGNTITYTLGGADAGLFTINAQTGEVFLIAPADFEAKASYVFTVVASDGQNPALTDTQTVTLNVTDVNEAPVSGADAVVTIAENGAAGASVFTASATDPDGDTITYSLGGADAGLFTINAQTGEVFLTAPANFEAKASYAFTVIASDGQNPALTDTQAVTLNVTDVNEAPVIGEDAVVTIAENGDAGALVFTAAATDEDGDDITYTLAGDDADLFTINAQTGEVFLTAPADFETQDSYSISIIASDGQDPALTDTQAVTINVTDVNEAPVSGDDAEVTIAENGEAGALVFTASATDPDGDDITYTLAGDDAELFTINAETGEVFLTAPADFERQPSYSITILASDGQDPALVDSQTVAITVSDEIDVSELVGGTQDEPLVVNAGIRAGDLTDTNNGFVEVSANATEVNIIDFGANDFILFDGLDPDDYTFQNDGNGNLVISRLDDDGSTTNIITLVGTVEGGIPGDALIVTEADAEAVLNELFGVENGDFFRGSSEAVEISTTGIDSANAAGARTTFIEDLNGPESFIVINNFRGDDLILFIDGNFDEVSFTTDPDDAKDLRIEYFDFVTNQASTIILNDVLREDGPIIFDEASAEAALVEALGEGDYFQVG